MIAWTGRSDARPQSFSDPRASEIGILDWPHSADPTSVTLTLADLSLEPTIYLVPECGDAGDERAVLKTVFSLIFEDTLNGWWRDRTAWPTPRPFGTSRIGLTASSTRHCST